MSSTQTTPRRPRRATLLAGACVLALSACGDTMDLDMRGPIGGLDTAGAARTATASRPKPDARGIISYPGYQVAVAQRGDTLGSLATRIGVDAGTLARYNGIQTGDPLRAGEVIALPGRVAEPAGGPITPGGSDITQIAGAAIDNASASQIQTSTLTPAATATPSGASGVQPVRHKVERGETAYTIARLYNVSIRSLAEWNGLGSDFSVREGQFLIIPVALPGAQNASFDASDVPATQPPGAGTPTPEPPSAAKPLPKEDTVTAAKAKEEPKEAPDLGKEQTAASAPKARMSYPVRGDIVRPYSKGKNDGIDIAASPGTAVKAADSGTVAAITQDTKGTPIIVVKHANNLLTVYSNVDNVAVKTGDKVSRGQSLAKIPSTGAAAVHFEVRNGFDSLDPVPYLTE